MRHPLRPRLPAVLATSLAVVAVGGLTGAALVVDTAPPGAVLTAELRVTPPAPGTGDTAGPTARHRSAHAARTPVTTPQAPAPLALAGAVRAAAAARTEADRTPCPSTRAAAPRLPGTGSRQGCPESPATDPAGPPLTP
ncbi:hypothetical protein LWC35_30425 [Pseudonocardia kujensis]|uniref:hypothetical protein n=1 Tax=Pseudonocardia kujensis TaxID=1128675 RepID=UPI001E4FD83B|nr:hypothetical protein [Pseudonocardia kujensis]MCE0767188.1 hypothetical protein [Pseudonocardia kujensis]